MIRGAVFDIDGVLLDSLGIWRDLGRRYLERNGRQAAPDLSRTLFSMSMEQGAEHLKTHYALSAAPEEIVQDLEKMLRDFYFYEVPAKEGAGELLELLKRNGIPMAAATSSPRAHVENALARTGLLSYFSRIYTTTEVGQSKHSPRVYQTAAGFLGAKPWETLVFEDSLYALRTAAAAGFYTVGVFDAMGEPDQAGMQETGKLYLRSLWDFKRLWPAVREGRKL